MKHPFLLVLDRHKDEATWHAAIGRVVVTFGTLERLMLAWASVFAGDELLLKRLHKADMKAIAPLLERTLQSRKTHWPKAAFTDALTAIANARHLIQDRNDAAHGWLGTRGNRPEGSICLLVAKIDGRPKTVYGVRDLKWLIDVGERVELATLNMRAALVNLANIWMAEAASCPRVSS